MTYPLYTTYAHLWPMLAPLESYESEMHEWSELVVAEPGLGKVKTLLDLGTGGGHHLYHLVGMLPGKVKTTAVDLSEAMLGRVLELLPRVQTLVGDMTCLKLERRFDLVTVHDSFCYLHEPEKVKGLFATIASHLNPGGLALVKVDALSDSFEGPYRYLTDFEGEDFDITLTHYEWDPVPGDHAIEVVYLFLERHGSALTTREERHTLGLFSRNELLQWASECGLQARFHDLEAWDEERENPLLVLSSAAQ